MALTDFNSLTIEDCGAALVSDAELSRLMAAALAEDGIDAGDISTLTIVPEGRAVTAELVARESGEAGLNDVVDERVVWSLLFAGFGTLYLLLNAVAVTALLWRRIRGAAAIGSGST